MRCSGPLAMLSVLLAAGCLVGPPVGPMPSSGPASSAAPATYVTPASSAMPMPSPTAVPSVPPSASPSPTAAPSPVPTFLPLLIDAPDGTAAPVGGTLRLRGRPYAAYVDQLADLRWGALDPAAAAVTPEGDVTVLAPGPLFLYAESRARRHFVLLAGLPDPPVARRLPLPAAPIQGREPVGDGVAWLGDEAAWQTYWRDLELLAPSPPPLPAGVDLGREVILAWHHRADGAEGAEVVGVTEGSVDLVLTAIPDSTPTPAMVVYRVALFALPRPAAGSRVRVQVLDPRRGTPNAVPPPPGVVEGAAR